VLIIKQIDVAINWMYKFTVRDSNESHQFQRYVVALENHIQFIICLMPLLLAPYVQDIV